MTDTLQFEAQQAANVVREGGVILYPTDTIWGIGCDASENQPVELIRDIKGREQEKSFIVLMKDIEQLRRYVAPVPTEALSAIRSTTRPLTVIYEGVQGLAPSIYANDQTVAIRIVNDAFCKRLIAELDKPIVSTSANVSGQQTAGDFASVPKVIKDRVDYIVTYRQEEEISSPPSRIIKIQNGDTTVIRQ